MNKLKQRKVETIPISLDKSRLHNSAIGYLTETFFSDLTGCYNWDYSDRGSYIKKLYEIGKRLNWDAQVDIDWKLLNKNLSFFLQAKANIFEHDSKYLSLNKKERSDQDRQSYAWVISQLLHLEQFSLIVASQLINCFPNYESKLFFASIEFDEARHVEVFNSYLTKGISLHYPINQNIKSLAERTIKASKWEEKFLHFFFMKKLSISLYQHLQNICVDPFLDNILELVLRDEIRHEKFGDMFLKENVLFFTEKSRGMGNLIYESCQLTSNHIFEDFVLMRFIDSFNRPEENLIKEKILHINDLFYLRLIPQLKTIGIPTKEQIPLFKSLDILDYQNYEPQEIPWGELEKPLFKKDES